MSVQALTTTAMAATVTATKSSSAPARAREREIVCGVEALLLAVAAPPALAKAYEDGEDE